MRSTSLLRLLAAFAFAAFVLLTAAAYLSFRAALATKIDRAAQMEADAVRPAAAARLACALLEHRLSLVSETGSQAVAAAFQRSFEQSSALVAYRAAGGDPAIAADAEKAFAAGKPPGPDAEIAFLRAIRALRAQAAQLTTVTHPSAPPAAARAEKLLLLATLSVIAALLAALATGRATGGH